jgi:transketolase
VNAIARKVPWLIGGAADLTPSTKTYLEFEDAGGDFAAGNYGARNLRFGVREHSMGAILNGLAHCDLRPFGATFLIFSDYMRPPTRLAALMELPVVYVFTHDSIGLGEDGPTHQPVEQLAALRAIPNLIVLRPCDANETAEAWRVAMQLQDRPAALALSRQKLPVIDRSRYAAADGVRRGAYVLAGLEEPEVLLIASGSEVMIALRAYEQLVGEGVKARVVSMPSQELFEEQAEAYRESVLPPACAARVVVEAAVGFGWDRYVGPTGGGVVQDTFGASAPAKDVQRHFGFTVDNVVDQVRKQMARNR